jgi:peptide/nickel transport system permease protein
MNPSPVVSETSGTEVRKAEGIYQAAFRSVLRNPLGRVGLSILALFLLAALLAPILAPYDPIENHRGDELARPSSIYPMGTDELGRDIWSRILYGSRITLQVGVLAVLLASLIGVMSGMVAGFVGGPIDSAIMRFWDMIQSFPAILVGVAVVAVLGPGALQSAVALAVINFPRFARLARACVLVEKGKEYVVAARAAGAGTQRIVLVHILPNAISPLLVQFAMAMVFAVLLEASLSFLGLGTQPPQPSWGAMLRASRRYLREAPWYGIAPGLIISILMLGLNFLSDAVRDAMDPTRVRLP